MVAFTGIWALLVFLILLNGFSAGVVATLHVRRSGRSRRSRVLMASGIAGLLPTTILIPEMLTRASVGAASVAGLIVGTAVLCGLLVAISLPGALIIARKLDGPGDAFRAFE